MHNEGQKPAAEPGILLQQRRAHFIGICGAGMSAVARLLMEAGYSVGGSDEAFYPPVSDYLTAHGIPYKSGYSARNIPPDTDIVVIGKHARLVPEENEEVSAAFASGIPVKSYPEVLAELTKPTENYVIAGSFGKSTCTALTAWTLLSSGKDPAYMVGALSPSLADNARLGDGNVFVLEGDEYPSANWDNTSKFLYFNAHHVLLTSCEHDHINVFPKLDDYLKPFRALVAQRQLRSIAACVDGAHVADVVQGAAAALTTYSLADPQADWHTGGIERSGVITRFDLVNNGRSIGKLSTSQLGEHSVQNAVGVAALLLSTGRVTFGELAQAVELFQGVRRRLELKTTRSRVPLYEDFGSSRPKLAAGIRAVRRQYPGRPLHIVFEPHTFSFRNRAALSWYDDLFDGADRVYLFEPPTHGASTHDQLSQAEIVERVASTGVPVVAVHDKEGLLTTMEPNLTLDSVVLVESSGSVGGSVPYLVNYLDNAF